MNKLFSFCRLNIYSNKSYEDVINYDEFVYYVRIVLLLGFPEHMQFTEFCNRYEILVGSNSRAPGTTVDGKQVSFFLILLCCSYLKILYCRLTTIPYVL